MGILTTVEIDAELASRTEEVGAISMTMIELDSHSGLQHLRRYPPTGATARRWAAIEISLGQLWDDLGRLTSILESARAVRAHGSKLDDDDRATLTRLLRERTLDVPHQRNPLVQNLTDPHIEGAGLTDTVERMRTAYPVVAQFLGTVDEMNSLVTEGLTPVLRQLDAAGATTPAEVVDLLETAATDPLSLTVQEVKARIADIAELAALHQNWASELANTAVALDELRATAQRAAQLRALAGQTVVAGAFPTRADAEPQLRAALQAITTPDPAALQSLRRRIDAELHNLCRDEELAQGLLDRQIELRGRLRVYQAKAARLGLAEDADLLSSGRIASGLLSRQPCDLAAVTRAIADYQQLIAEKRGTTR
jgi:hypothetical protein